MENKIFTHPCFGEMYYLLNIPEAVKKMENPPMLVFLHGVGERGKDFELIKKHAIPRYLEDGAQIPAITLCPQCPAGFIWNNVVAFLKSFIDFAVKEYHADPSKVSLTGISMGGYGTWEMAMCYPEMFRKIAPICGGGTPWRAGQIRAKIRAFHGDIDSTVPKEASYEMVDAALAAGKDAKLTVFHNVGHDSWDEAYKETKLIDWLLAD